MLGKMLLSLVIVLSALGVYLYIHLGLSSPVTVEIGSRGPFFLVYKNHTGAYHEIIKSISEVESWAKDNNLRCELTFGEYLDDPAAVDQDRLRSRGGCILDNPPAAPLPEELSSEARPKHQYVIGHFAGSPSVGPFKVYPKVRDFIETQRLKQKGAVMETYLIRGEKVTTEYLFPLE